MKKLISLTLALCMVLSCALFSAAAAEPTKIRIAVQGISNNDTMDPISGIVRKGSKELEALIESKLDNVDVEMVYVAGDGWIQTMEVLCTSGEVDIGWYTNQVLAGEWFYDNREFMAKDPVFTEEYFAQNFTPIAQHYAHYHTYDYPQYNGAIIGLPYDMSARWFMYDKVLFEQWGVELPPAEELTLPKLMELAKQMTGTNPVTGEQNYGCFIRPYWCEWLAVGMDVFQPLKDPEMNIANFDIDKYVDPIGESEKTLEYFTTLKGLLECCPPGAASGTGYENWFTEDNNIAIMLDVSHTVDYLLYAYADASDVTDRFIPIIPVPGEQGMYGFPEIHSFAVCKTTQHPDLCWEINKLLATDTDILNWMFANRSWEAVSCLVDTTGIDIMENEFSKVLYQDRLDHSFITDDYWHWREPLNSLLTNYFTGTMSPEDASAQLEADIRTWISNKQAQMK